MGLQGLEQRLRQELELLNLPAASWVPPSRGGTLDVAIIGAGVGGLSAAAALRFLGIANVAVFDRAPSGREGPWLTFARMETLRTPKDAAGPALGIPSLTFRAWFESQFGPARWQALDKIATTMWMDYLVWYRRVLALPVENDTEVTAVTPSGERVALDLRDASGRRRRDARRVVLATGFDGFGGPAIPGFLRGVDRGLWAHAADDIDFTRLRGKRVGVIGAGASAMDNAATALEAGAASAEMFVRRDAVPAIQKFVGVAGSGLAHGFAGLPPAWKWRFLRYELEAQIPPPRESVLRVFRHRNVRLHLGSAIESAAAEGDALALTTRRGTHRLDFLIAATGFCTDIALRPELAAIAAQIRLWKHSYIPASDEASEELANAPELGPGFALQERVAGACPGLGNIHCLTYAASLSHGKLASAIPASSQAANRLARAIARSLFVEDRALHFERLTRYATPELRGDEWGEAAVDIASPGRRILGE
jgi:FAD-dependent urate hydroxylase